MRPQNNGGRRCWAAILIVIASCAPAPSDVALSRWHELRSEHFRLWTETDPQQAGELLVHLERVHRILLDNAMLRAEDAPPSPLIVVMKDSRTIQALTRLHTSHKFGVVVVPGGIRRASTALVPPSNTPSTIGAKLQAHHGTTIGTIDGASENGPAISSSGARSSKAAMSRTNYTSGPFAA